MATRDSTTENPPTTTSDTPSFDPPDDPARVLWRVFGDHDGRSYPGVLPAELVPWHLYLSDAGHSVAVVLDCHWGEQEPEQKMIAAPVRSVLRAGVQWRNGWPVVDLPYDDDLGLRTPKTDDEL